MEVATVGQRSKWVGICAGVLGVTLSLAPLTAASATNHKAKNHSTSTKGSNPNSAMCKDVKTEQSGSNSVSTAMEKAMTSGNFAQAKQAMLNAYNVDEGNVQKALAVIRTAPANVQSAFSNLLSFVKQIRTDIQNASSLQGLVASFATLGKNTQLETDGTTIANWYTSVCGGTLVTPTTVSVP
jgi:flagellum-specific peptidoglycan hydrolase FlgJ